MKTLIVEDVDERKLLVSLENVLSVYTGGGVYDTKNTNVYINYGFDQTVSWEITKDSVMSLLLKIQSVLESD